MFWSNKKILYFAITILVLLFLSFFFLAYKPIISFTVINISSSLLFIIICAFIYKIDLDNHEIILIAAVFILIRFLFINTIPIGSDDIYRYMWDGKLQAVGMNPYLFTPNDPGLIKFHSELLPKYVNFPDMKTIYFPLSQWLFFLGYLLSGESVWGYKLLLLIAEMVSIFSIYGLLKHLRLNSKFVLFYILCPLSIIHFALDAHLDAFGFPLILSSIYFYLKEKKLLSSVLLGLSLSIKPVGLVLLPVYFLKEKGVLNKLRVSIIPVVIFFIQFIPYIFTTNPFEAFLIYTKNWIYNGFIFDLLNLYFRNNQTTRMICGILLVITLIPVYFCVKETVNKTYYAVLFMMIFSPIVHPWYIGWVAILIPFTQKWSGIVFVSLSSLTAFTVLNYQLYGIWKDYLPVLIIEYIPVVILIIWEMRQDFKLAYKLRERD